MKVQAIVFAPIISLTAIGLILSLFTKFSFPEEVSFIYLLIIVAALLVQLSIELLFYLIKKWIEMNFKSYLQTASFACFMIGLYSFFITTKLGLEFYNGLTNTFISFSFFYIYSIGNALTYNYLYFSKVSKQ